eukprot:403361899
MNSNSANIYAGNTHQAYNQGQSNPAQNQISNSSFRQQQQHTYNNQQQQMLLKNVKSESALGHHSNFNQQQNYKIANHCCNSTSQQQNSKSYAQNQQKDEIDFNYEETGNSLIPQSSCKIIPRSMSQSLLLFQEKIPYYGYMPMVFYLPNATDADKDFIESKGGLMSSIVECFTYQVTRRPIKESQFHGGNVYDIQWLHQSAAVEKLLNPEPFLIKVIDYQHQNYNQYKHHNDHQNEHAMKSMVKLQNPPETSSYQGSHVGSNIPGNQASKKQSGQRTRFTIRELIKIFEVTQQNPCKKNKNQVYWQRFIKRGFFPGRSVNSVNAQWQKFCHENTADNAVVKAIEMGMPYSTMYPTARHDQVTNTFILSSSIIKIEPDLVPLPCAGTLGIRANKINRKQQQLLTINQIKRQSFNGDDLKFKDEEINQQNKIKLISGTKRQFNQRDLPNNDNQLFSKMRFDDSEKFFDGASQFNNPRCSYKIIDDRDSFNSNQSDDIIKLKRESIDLRQSEDNYLKRHGNNYKSHAGHNYDLRNQGSSQYQQNLSKRRVGAPYNGSSNLNNSYFQVHKIQNQMGVDLNIDQQLRIRLLLGVKKLTYLIIRTIELLWRFWFKLFKLSYALYKFWLPYLYEKSIFERFSQLDSENQNIENIDFKEHRIISTSNDGCRKLQKTSDLPKQNQPSDSQKCKLFGDEEVKNQQNQTFANGQLQLPYDQNLLLHQKQIEQEENDESEGIIRDDYEFDQDHEIFPNFKISSQQQQQISTSDQKAKVNSQNHLNRDSEDSANSVSDFIATTFKQRSMQKYIAQNSQRPMMKVKQEPMQSILDNEDLNFNNDSQRNQ